MAAPTRQDRDQIKCEICLCKPNHPKLLSCFHSFCKVCLQRKIEETVSDILPCPQCGMEIVVPPSKADDFQDDFLQAVIQEVATVYDTNMRYCDVCRFIGENIQSLYYCIDCRFHLCERDKKTHRATPGQRGHIVISYAVLHAGKYDVEIASSSKVVTCEIHSIATPMQVSFFCENCDDLACDDCVLYTHEGHPLSSLQEARKSKKDRIKDVLQQIKRVNRNKKEIALLLEQDLADYKFNKERIIREIRDQRKLMISNVKKLTADSVQNVKCLYSENETLKKKVFQSLLNQKEIFDNIVNFATEAMAYKSDIFVLGYFKTISENMELCLQRLEITQNTPSQRYVFEFEDRESLKQTLQPLMGTVKETTENQKSLTERNDNSRTHPTLVCLDNRKRIPAYVLVSTFETKGVRAVSTLQLGEVIVLSSSGLHVYDHFGHEKNYIRKDSKDVTCDVTSYRGYLVVTVNGTTPGIVIFDKDLTKVNFFPLQCKERICSSLNLAIDEKKNIGYLSSFSTNKVYRCTFPKLEMKPFITEGLISPHYLYVTKESCLVVSSSLNNTVTVFDDRGIKKWIYGCEGCVTNQLIYPKGICVDEMDNVYIADFYSCRIQILNMHGEFCKFVETPEGFSFPCALHYSNGLLYVTCQLPNRLYIFRRVNLH